MSAYEEEKMKALEFQAELATNHTIMVPDGIAKNIPLGQPLRILVLIPESMEDQEWELMGAVEFGQGYAECDAIYDHLSAR